MRVRQLKVVAAEHRDPDVERRLVDLKPSRHLSCCLSSVHVSTGSLFTQQHEDFGSSKSETTSDETHPREW